MARGDVIRQASKRVAVVNAGSSTLKLASLEAGGGELRRLAQMELQWRREGPDGIAEVLAEGLERLGPAPDGFGHRVVHGGADLVAPTVVTDPVEATLADLIPLAPLHNAPAVAALREVRRLHPEVPSVAVFDTAFHADRPAVSTRYPLPPELVGALKLKRYGFHGIAHESLVEALAEAEAVPVERVNAVTLQLGAGCSACAVAAGRSLETSMGYTPLEGLVMATRCGSLDPAIVLRLLDAGYAADQIELQLTRRSGLTGLCGEGDMRRILTAAADGDADAELALALFCHRIVLTVGGYFTLLGGEGALAFGGGIGSRSPEVRERVARGLVAWNVVLDLEVNRRNAPGRISAAGSRPVYALRTDEERVIGRAVVRKLWDE